MTERPEFNPIDDHRDMALEVDVLIGRIVDGEAAPDDLDRFEQDPANLRLLAERVHHQARLAAALEDDLNRIDRIGLPVVRTISASRVLGPAVSVLGWAAAIALAFAIGFGVFEGKSRALYRAVDLQQITPHLDLVLESDELDPLAIRTEQLPDGRWRITWLRRTVEVIETDAWNDDWVRETDKALPDGM